MTKNQNKYTSYGQKLKSARVKQKLSQAAVARKLQISSKQIASIENGSTRAWEGAYSVGYVDGYRRLLGLKEFNLDEPEEIQAGNKLEPLSDKSFIVSKLITSGLIAICVLAVVGYVFWQVLVLTSPPPLKLYEPAEDKITNQTNIKISGKTSENTDVSINGQSILTEPNGEFTADIPLKPGVNELSVTATNRLTKQETINRTIIANYQIDPIEKK